jgi:hypothetical protein
MQVVAVVSRRIDALRAIRFDVRAVGLRGEIVNARGRFIVADALIDVRGHVHEMTRGRRQRAEPIRAWQRTFRQRRRFDGVNIKMIRADVIRVAPQDGFEHGDHFFRPRRGSSVRRP